jgi:hypothetical protein
MAQGRVAQGVDLECKHQYHKKKIHRYTCCPLLVENCFLFNHNYVKREIV